MKNTGNFNWLLKTPIAHRGLHKEGVPENSLAAFLLAIKKRIPFEIDIHITKEGEVVCIHDDNLKRMTGKDIDTYLLTEKIRKGLYLTNSKEKIPLLEDVLSLVSGMIPILIELKNIRNNPLLETKVCKILSSYNGEYAVQSFNPLSIYRIRGLAPNITRGILSSDFKAFNSETSSLNEYMIKKFKLNFLSMPDFIAYDIRALPNMHINKFIKEKLPIIGWTIRQKKDITIAKKYCNNIIFENDKTMNLWADR
jgi:glycerophosphoryl diester phosphodiesterase